MTKSVDISNKLSWGSSKSGGTKSAKQNGHNGKSTLMDKPMPSQKQMMGEANATTKLKKVEKDAV